MELLETQTLASLNKYLRDLFKKAAKKENRGVVRLVSKPEFNYALVKSNELLVKDMENPKISELTKRVEREMMEDETNIDVQVLENCDEWLRKSSSMRMLKANIEFLYDKFYRNSELIGLESPKKG